MSNYRRLISYIYAYEGGIKGKNIGFAKIEARNGQCKIQVNVKNVYVGNSDPGVYLLAGGDQLFLGKVFIRNGAGEFRAVVPVGNVENSGIGMDQCYGLTIHSAEDTWQSYTTIWEDAVAQAAELQPREEEEQRKEQNDAVERAAAVDLDEVAAEMPAHHKSSIVEEIEAEIQAQSKTEELEEGLEAECCSPASEIPKPSSPEIPVIESELEPGAEDRERLNLLEQEEMEAGQPGRLWQHFRKTYPKVQAFDYANGCEILMIKPQDIGLLPRETWAYGNNSFLLHGYYSYRYLILVKLNNPQGGPRYLLGVPGHYYSNEKYMASMFGFPSFVLSKMQPAGDARFGYWYTDINMGNQ